MLFHFQLFRYSLLRVNILKQIWFYYSGKVRNIPFVLLFVSTTLYISYMYIFVDIHPAYIIYVHICGYLPCIYHICTYLWIYTLYILYMYIFVDIYPVYIIYVHICGYLPCIYYICTYLWIYTPCIYYICTYLWISVMIRYEARPIQDSYWQ